jgi:hypothetical protein
MLYVLSVSIVLSFVAMFMASYYIKQSKNGAYCYRLRVTSIIDILLSVAGILLGFSIVVIYIVK